MDFFYPPFTSSFGSSTESMGVEFNSMTYRFVQQHLSHLISSLTLLEVWRGSGQLSSMTLLSPCSDNYINGISAYRLKHNVLNNYVQEDFLHSDSNNNNNKTILTIIIMNNILGWSSSKERTKKRKRRGREGRRRHGSEQLKRIQEDESRRRRTCNCQNKGNH